MQDREDARRAEAARRQGLTDRSRESFAAAHAKALSWGFTPELAPFAAIVMVRLQGQLGRGHVGQGLVRSECPRCYPAAFGVVDREEEPSS